MERLLKVFVQRRARVLDLRKGEEEALVVLLLMLFSRGLSGRVDEWTSGRELGVVEVELCWCRGLDFLESMLRGCLCLDCRLTGCMRNVALDDEIVDQEDGLTDGDRL